MGRTQELSDFKYGTVTGHHLCQVETHRAGCQVLKRVKKKVTFLLLQRSLQSSKLPLEATSGTPTLDYGAEET